MTRSLRDALGEAARLFHWRRWHMGEEPHPPWIDLPEHDQEYWRADGDTYASIAARLGITITMGGEPENTER